MVVAEMEESAWGRTHVAVPMGGGESAAINVSFLNNE
jgi:hypothetical protein